MLLESPDVVSLSPGSRLRLQRSVFNTLFENILQGGNLVILKWRKEQVKALIEDVPVGLTVSL